MVDGCGVISRRSSKGFSMLSFEYMSFLVFAVYGISEVWQYGQYSYRAWQ
jgi:hypothetical protein